MHMRLPGAHVTTNHVHAPPAQWLHTVYCSYASGIATPIIATIIVHKVVVA